MSNLKACVLGLIFVSLTTACGKKAQEEEGLAVDPVEASIESGLTMISGMSDEQAGSSYALRTSEKSPINFWETILGAKAYADDCVRAYFQSCQGGVKEATFNSCSVAGTLRTLTGQVTLSYSHMSCTISANGDSVVRTYDLDIEGPRGGRISHTSGLGTDYRGFTYSGGGRIEKTVAGWDLEVLGRHSEMSFRGRRIFDVSIRTIAPIAVTGGLSRSSRVMNGGQLEVNHNLAEFTSVLTPNNLGWTNTCCHPTSGSLSVNYSGSKTGSATVTFQGCGSATVDHNGQQQQIEFSYCD